MSTVHVKFLPEERRITELCEVHLSELSLTQMRTQTYFDFVRVPPMLFEYTIDCHVAREDHHIIVAFSASQLTFLTWRGEGRKPVPMNVCTNLLQ